MTKLHNLPPILIDPIASYIISPVYDVNAKQPVAKSKPATAALSSSKTATALGSRPRTTVNK